MKWRKKVFFITFIAMNLVDDPALEVTIEQGTLIGKTSSDRSYFEYLGIPYANFNSTTRFRAPGPPPHWEGIYRAVEEPPSCPQNIFIGIIGNEDCLKLNVYVPASDKKPFPVLVYVHGGAFSFGSGGLEPVIDDMPINIIKNKPFSVDAMYGSTSKEGLFIMGSETIESLEERKGGSLFAGDLQFYSEDEENPTPDPNEFGVKWEPSMKDNMKFLHIDHELKMGSMPNETIYQFWRDIYDKYRITHTI
ncbi:unnamed protein product [Danaus chrysippus]|uniref:(African queen) hypothetical protein n=1 Tax=Danaus chrysippus TaxID=151541 RepID=A0A8J2QE36_9NEOP|nr:unnamed protein product [Danaus chrysippus]